MWLEAGTTLIGKVQSQDVQVFRGAQFESSACHVLYEGLDASQFVSVSIRLRNI